MDKISGTEDAWDTRQIGADEEYVARVAPNLEQQIDESLGLQMISIRLDRTLIEAFKAIGKFHGIGYQPLMRDVLKRFAERELLGIVQGLVAGQNPDDEPGAPVPPPPAAKRVRKDAAPRAGGRKPQGVKKAA
ncbi:MAG: hypothetical protein KF778_15955 [Rhodocyclaceae bacterium]|nr:hypothetical protein [Rhodocyclaceae bacterium]MBX3669895.1 hypothetical protein [Rhodocyclaceae bacterium]